MTEQKKITVLLPATRPTAIQERRKALESPELLEKLSPVEYSIFRASTKTQIREIDDRSLVGHVDTLVKYVAKDVGIKGEIEQYERIRAMDILKRYYGELSLDEVKTAFELSIVGELDNYLPRNSSGSPDRGHYQSFSVEYLSKILTAYRKRKRSVMVKTSDVLRPALPEPSNEEEIRSARMSFIEDFNLVLLRLKYTGVYEASSILEMLIYKELRRWDLIGGIPISDDDKESAFYRLIGKSVSGLVSKYRRDEVISKGKEHPDVRLLAFERSRSTTIKQALQEIADAEIQIINHLKKIESC